MNAGVRSYCASIRRTGRPTIDESKARVRHFVAMSKRSGASAYSGPNVVDPWAAGAVPSAAAAGCEALAEKPAAAGTYRAPKDWIAAESKFVFATSTADAEGSSRSGVPLVSAWAGAAAVVVVP